MFGIDGRMLWIASMSVLHYALINAITRNLHGAFGVWRVVFEDGDSLRVLLSSKFRFRRVLLAVGILLAYWGLAFEIDFWVFERMTFGIGSGVLSLSGFATLVGIYFRFVETSTMVTVLDSIGSLGHGKVVGVLTPYDR